MTENGNTKVKWLRVDREARKLLRAHADDEAACEAIRAMLWAYRECPKLREHCEVMREELDRIAFYVCAEDQDRIDEAINYRKKRR